MTHLRRPVRALAALATPTTIGTQGRLATSAGGPVSDGVYAMKVSLYPAADAPQAVWEHTFLNVPVAGGLFALTLGGADQPTLDDGLFAWGAATFVGVEVSGEPELPRAALRPTPYAVRAMSAAMADQAMSAGQAAKADTAATAEELSCTGCVTLQHLAADVGAAFLGAGGGTLSGKLVASAGVDLAGTALENAVLSGAKLAAVDVQKAGCDAAQHPQIQGADATPGLANVGTAAAGIAGDTPYNSTFLGRPYTELLAELPTEDAWLRITGFDVGKFEAEMADTAGETSANKDCQTDVYTPNVKLRGKQPNGSVQETSPPAPLIAEVHHSAWNPAAQTNWILAAGSRPPGSGSTGTWGMFGGGTVLRIDGIEVSNAKGRVYVR
jgi:hypothetical protein